MDFIMYYEHHAREIDGLLLLKAELAKRGHTAELVHYTFGRRWMYHRFIDFDVALVPFLYNDRAAVWTMSRHVSADKLVNLQWEQVVRAKRSDIVAPYGTVRLSAAHLCWGLKGMKILQDKGVSSDNTRITGALHLDLCTEPFRSYYATKSELAKETGLSADKRWFLFVSNMVFANEAAPTIQPYKESQADYIAYSKRCLATILDWIKRYCEEHPDSEFVYRPHPSETVSDDAIAAVDKIGNFHIIRAGTAREWMMRSDVCFVHSTTTIAEIYAAGKTCGVLRPEPCPEEYDMPVYSGCESISDYEAFARRCDGENAEFPVDEINFREYYDHRPDMPAYRRICDVLYDILKRERTEPDAISLLDRSVDDTARCAIRVMDVIALFSDMFRYGEIKMAGIFMRIVDFASQFRCSFNPVVLRDWSKQNEIPEKQRKLCDIIGAPELPAKLYLERAIEAHLHGKSPSDFDSAGYSAVCAELKRLIKSASPEPEILFAQIKDLLPLSQAELDDYGKRLLKGHVGEMAAVILRLVRCKDYPSWEDSYAAAGRFIEPALKAKRVIMYGAGGFAPQVRAACDKLGIEISTVWDKRAGELKAFGGVPVAAPFSEKPENGALVLIALSYNKDYYPVREELLQKGYKVMDGAMAIACAEWEKARNEK